MDPRRSINSKHKKHYIKANHITLFKTSGKEKTLKAAKGKGYIYRGGGAGRAGRGTKTRMISGFSFQKKCQ